MPDVQATVPEPNLDQFFKENIVFIEFALSKMVAKYGLPKGMDGKILCGLTDEPDSVGALINSCSKLWRDSLKPNRRRIPERIASMENSRDSRKDGLEGKLKALFSEVLGTNGVLVLETPIDLGALRKLSGLEEGDMDLSVYACWLSLGENPYESMMKPVAEGGLQEIIAARVTAYAARPNNNGIGPKTLSLILSVLPEIGGMTLAQAEAMVQERQKKLPDRDCEKTRKDNRFSRMLQELLGISSSDGVIDAKGLLRLLKILDDGYSIKAAASAVKANLEPQAEGPAQQQASEAITTSQSQQEEYRKFLQENNAFIRYALSQKGDLGEVTVRDSASHFRPVKRQGLDVLLRLLEKAGEDTTIKIVGDLVKEYRTSGARYDLNTQKLEGCLFQALGRKEGDISVTESDTTPMDLTVLKKLCGMKEGELDPSVRVCMRCVAEESYTVLLSPVEEGGVGEIIANEITRLAQSSRRNHVGDKLLGIILGALPHIEGKSLMDAAAYVSLPEWALELCARLNSDPMTPQNQSLDDAVRKLLEIKGKISEGVFLRAIQSKLPSLKGGLKTFHQKLTSEIGASIPDFLRWEEHDKEQQSTRTSGGNALFYHSLEWFGVNNQQGTFDQNALLHVLGIPEDGYSMAKANEIGREVMAIQAQSLGHEFY